ncbi:hypothetical protein IV203_038766 [Nitzschia inconspicua]|uniref:Uncharacterized protein n=1 Tax=Nitzschia inconspicua TaxID=303405 RepID=A0A9K3PZ88_9STRA|nr:hypothetical protein IV203_038766 [Nitzschia inconspicua]
MSASQGLQQLPPPIHVLRGILRRLRVHVPEKVPSNNNRNTTTTTATSTTTTSTTTTRFNPMQRFVLDQYRTSKAETSPVKIQELQNVAVNYYTLRQDLAERSRLHQLDSGAEMQLTAKELSRRAAARAGLQLPDLDPELEQDLK